MPLSSKFMKSSSSFCFLKARSQGLLLLEGLSHMCCHGRAARCRTSHTSRRQQHSPGAAGGAKKMRLD